MDDWKPIETAPKDGTNMDVWCPDEEGGYRVADAYWSTPLHKWQRVGGADGRTWAHDPTHWMPIPPPPLPRKETPMRSPEDFPADIRKAAFAVVARGYDEGLVEVVCRALMERDRAATERAAKIADEFSRPAHEQDDFDRAWEECAAGIAAAIRSQQ